MDSSLLSNIQKLFYERIEVFGTVDFSKLSVVTGIIKIVLKVHYTDTSLDFPSSPTFMLYLIFLLQTLPFCFYVVCRFFQLPRLPAIPRSQAPCDSSFPGFLRLPRSQASCDYLVPRLPDFYRLPVSQISRLFIVINGKLHSCIPLSGYPLYSHIM